MDSLINVLIKLCFILAFSGVLLIGVIGLYAMIRDMLKALKNE